MKVIGICGLAGSGKDTVANHISKDYGYIQVALADPFKRLMHTVFNFSEEQLWGASKHRNAKAVPDWKRTELQFLKYYKTWLRELTQGNASTTHESDLLEWFYSFKAKSFELAEGKTSPRIVLQSFGTEWGRETYFENVWIDYALDVVAPKILQPAYIYSKSAGLMKQSAPPGVVISDVRFRNEVEQLSKRQGKIIKIVRKSLDDVGELGITNHKSEADQLTMGPELFNMLLNNDGTLEDLRRDVDVYMTST